MLAALIARRAGPATMAAWAKGRLRSKIPVLAQALSGRRRDHHWRLPASQVAHLDFLDEQIEALGTDMTRCLRTCARRRATTPLTGHAADL